LEMKKKSKTLEWLLSSIAVNFKKINGATPLG